MSWMAPSGTKYLLCLLDTNAISEIIKNPHNEGTGFIDKFGPKGHVPCVTIYSIIELRRKKELFQQYLNFFSVYPSILVKPIEMIFSEEQKAVNRIQPVNALLNAFSPLGQDSSYNLRNFMTQIFDDPVISKYENNWRTYEYDILEIWNKNKENFSPTRTTGNARDAEKFVDEAGLQFLIGHFPKWAKFELNAGRVPQVGDFPSLQVSLYSVYYRMFDANWTQKPQEVTDLRIIAATPYVDKIITEKFQAEILRKIKNRVPAINNLEIFKLKSIRKKN